jgi:hypothetical protein
MDGSIKVAVVQGDRRRGAVAQALGLIADDVRDRVHGTGAVVVPTLDELGRSWASTDRDTLSAATDALLAAGAGTIDVAAGRGAARSASVCFDRLGYRAETAGRPVSYHDLDAEPDAWTTVESPDGRPEARLRVAGFRSRSRVRTASFDSASDSRVSQPSLIPTTGVGWSRRRPYRGSRRASLRSPR